MSNQYLIILPSFIIYSLGLQWAWQFNIIFLPLSIGFESYCDHYIISSINKKSNSLGQWLVNRKLDRPLVISSIDLSYRNSLLQAGLSLSFNSTVLYLLIGRSAYLYINYLNYLSAYLINIINSAYPLIINRPIFILSYTTSALLSINQAYQYAANISAGLNIINKLSAYQYKPINPVIIGRSINYCWLNIRPNNPKITISRSIDYVKIGRFSF